MINVTIYTGRGDFGRRIALDLAKSQIARRIEKGMQDGINGWGPADLERLDSGRLSLSRLLLLVPADEIQAASDRALVKSSEAEQIHSDIQDLLVAWTLAQGGPAAVAGAPKPSSPAKLLRKSPPVPMHETAERHGWEPDRAVVGGTRWVHPSHKHHELTLHARGTWMHHGPDCSEAGSAAELDQHLKAFHQKDGPIKKSQAANAIIEAANEAHRRSGRP